MRRTLKPRRSNMSRSVRPKTLLENLEDRLLLSTINVTAGQDLKMAIQNASAGDTILVGPGTYNAESTAYDSTIRFLIDKSLTLASTGGAGSTFLGIGNQPQGLVITASNVTVRGFTINGGQFCVTENNPLGGNLSNIVLQSMILNPSTANSPSAPGGHGIFLNSVSNSLIDNVTVNTSYGEDLYIGNGSFSGAVSGNNIISNDTFNGTVTGHAVYVLNSAHNQFIHNTITQASIGGIDVDNSDYTVLLHNSITGDATGEVIFTNGSDFGTIGMNSLISTQYAKGNTTDGTGIWLNSESDGNWVYGNTISGEPENGIAIFLSSNNLIEGNDVSGNYQGGIFVWNAAGYSNSHGNTPTNNIITRNYIHNDVTNAGVNLRGAKSTIVTDNYILGNSTGKGTSLDNGIEIMTTDNTLIRGNIISNFENAIYFYSDATNVTYFQNRAINTFYNVVFQPATATFDAGAVLGGNYWNGFNGGGNPGATPYTNFLLDAHGNTGGGYVDRHPYSAESLGLAYTASVDLPTGGEFASGGTHLLVWDAPAAVKVKLIYSSSETGDVTIADQVPNTGLYKWTIPSTTAASDYVIKVVPEDSTGAAKGTTGVSNQFTINSSGLFLISPLRNAQFQAGGTARIVWKSTNGDLISVQLQTDGGSWTTLAANVSNDYADITLPNVNTNKARIRIVDQTTGAKDTEGSYFTISNAAAVTSNFSPSVLVDSIQKITWTSPAGAYTVSIDIYDGVNWITIATQAPNTGKHLWEVPDHYTNNAQVRVTFYNVSNAVISSATSGTFSIAYTSATGASTPRYRLYLPDTNEHLYTTDANEYAVLATRGWQQEGSPYSIYNGPVTVGGVAATPIYRLYDAGDKQHFWTSDRNEYLTLRTTTTWNDEGVAGYTFGSQATGTIGLYRLNFTSTTLHLHLWTTDANEYAVLATKGWVQEGLISWVLANAG